MTSSDLWSAETAARYDESSAAMFAPDVLDPAVDLLAELAGAGPVLELAIGTGRVAVPLHRRGLTVRGIELSGPMAAGAITKEPALEIIIGDMARATTSGLGEHTLVYVVWNSLGNVRTQDEQVAVFANAAAHLAPGGRFVVELLVPPLRRFVPGAIAVPFDVSSTHVGLDTLDPVTQQATSHHYTRTDDGTYRYGESNFRYVWPAELDLMARLAGLEPEARWADWHRAPFTVDSESHVSVWRKPVSGAH